MPTLRIRRGIKSTIPTLQAGEPGWCTDTRELFIGDGAINRLIGPAGYEPEFQNNLIASVLVATDMAALANRELDRFRHVRIQEGETTIFNRGVISGCTITRQAANTRMLSLATGSIFMHGRDYGVTGNVAAATVPPNGGTGSATSQVYLFLHANGSTQCECAPLNVPTPSNGLTIYTITVPAGSTGGSGAFTITDVRRLSPGWPNVFVSPAVTNISLPRVLPDANYAVLLDVVSCEGGRQQIGALEVEDRLTNGFKIYLAGAADAVRIRYSVQRMI